MKTISYRQDIPCAEEYDVIVAGGGVAGIAAAVAAKRAGKKVLLIEKTTMAGGLATTGLVNLFVPMCNGRGVKIMSGMVDEFIRISTKYGWDYTTEDWKSGKQRYMVKFSAHIFAMALVEFMEKEGVDMLFDAQACRPVMNGKIAQGVVVESTSGAEYYPCKILVDTTGTGILMREAGVPTIIGKNYFTLYGQIITMESMKTAIEKNNVRFMINSIPGGCASLYGTNHPKDMPFFDGTDIHDVNTYLIKNQMAMLANLAKTDRTQRDLVTLPLMPQLRTICCIQGDYVMKAEDAFKHFDDSIAAINDFDRRDYLYEVPYRTLIHHDFGNIITAGRSAAAEGYAWDVLRVIPPAIVTGQAAGVAAAMAIDAGCGIPEVDIRKLRKELEAQGSKTRFDDALIPKEGTLNSSVENNDQH